MTSVSSFHSISTALAFSLVAGSAAAAERIVEVHKPPALGKYRNAYPRIEAPADEAERQINAAVARLDAKLVKAFADCRKSGGPYAEWLRTIEVTMRGPRFLSYSIVDSASCNRGAQEVDDTAIVYDLTTGAPVDWSKLLPPQLVGTVTLSEHMDGTKMVSLRSDRLYELYQEQYPKGSHAGDKDCIEAVEEAGAEGPPSMTPYLDARAGGLAIIFDLPKFARACSDAVVLSIATLRAEKTPEPTLKAIEAAHATGK